MSESQKVTREAAEKVAMLSRLKMSPEECGAYAQVLSNVLESFEQIAKVDTTGVKPLVTPSDIVAVYRPDEVQRTVNSDEMLQNAPEKSGRLFKVPPVV